MNSKLKQGVGWAGGAAVILITSFAVWRISPHSGPVKKTTLGQQPLPAAAKDLQAFVETHRKDADPAVQDRVGAARIRLAYQDAGRGDFAKARQTLLQTAKETKGTGKMSSDFGGVTDQAAYQAICCLVGEGKPKEARAEFIEFMKTRPLSPLATAAYRRIERIDGHQPPPDVQGLLQKDLSLQQSSIRFEESVCGPKCVEHLLNAGLLPTAKRPDYKQIAKLCGTTEQGTSIAQLRKGLSALGVKSFGYELNVEDLAKAPKPAIVLIDNHYVAVLKIQNGICTFYDPKNGVEETAPMTKDVSSGLPALLFSPFDLP